jgi:signal transduction histidine kinase
MPIYSSTDKFVGAVVLSLDHRHLMEFSQHVLPGSVEKTVFPSYMSGNYAFIFDDEGWIITHPNFWDIRGLYHDGKPVPPYSSSSSKEDIETGRIPFNLYHAGFIHPNYPVVASAVREKKSGYLDTTNVGGARKVMAYAPILYSTGDYARHGIFGGVTIGFQTDLFHEPARAATSIIHDQIRSHLKESGLILTVTAALALFAAWRISRGISRPLAHFTEQAKALANGGGSSRVEVSSKDEVGELATDFNRMADELERRNSHLMETLAELDRSRQEVTGERNFMEGVVNSISSAILPFSCSGLLISINTNGRTILGEAAETGEHYHSVFSKWPELVERIDATVAMRRPFGREPFTVGDRCFDIGIFPIGQEMEQGITVTIRDETEKERMREEMTRMDRFASLGKLSAGIAHEIRNPLTGITLLLDDLHDRSNFDPESRDMLGKSLREIERVEKLINALLSYASPPRSEFSQGEIGKVIEDTLLFFRKACEKAGIALFSRVGNLPNFTFDPDKIRQMLLNLLRNALIATETGGQISVVAESEGETIKLAISDNGFGIPAADLDRVFEPFFTRSQGGTGLGLSITQRIVEEHHGTISVNSIEGEGTTFIVRIPLNSPLKDTNGKNTDN